MKISIRALCLLVLAGAALVAAERKVVCYFTNWSVYRQGIGKYSPGDIDASLCTHILYAFAVLDGSGKIKIYDEWIDVQSDHLGKVGAIRQQNPSVKVMLAVGGWNAGSGPFSKMAATSSSRKIFIDSVIVLLDQYKYDGLDLDWEYPAQRAGSSPQDKQNFSLLVKELQAAFSNHARSSGRPKMLLSSAVGPSPATSDAAYEKNTICSDLDFVNLMMYDIHGSWESVTGHNAPLYASDKESTPQNVIDAMTKNWINAGCARDKLILGLPLYGRSWTLKSSSVEIGSPAGNGNQGPYTGEAGILAYYEICQKLSGGWKHVYDSKAVQAIAYGDGQWVSYDNEESISTKVKYIHSMGLGGAMVWSLDGDDFTGQGCGRGKYPLLKTINNGLGGTVQPPPPSPTTASTTRRTTTQVPATTTKSWRTTTKRWETTTRQQTGTCAPKCPSKGWGYYPDRCDKHLFYICTNGSLYQLTCGYKMYYNDSCKCCVGMENH